MFCKYIEGEVEFDVLDADDYLDIATTSRQDFDQDDKRFKKLMEYIDIIVKDLIDEWLKLKKISDVQTDKHIFNRNTLKKEYFINSFKENNSDISPKTLTYISEKLTGDYLKDKTFLFLSHSKKDKTEIDMWQDIFLYLRWNERSIARQG